MYHIDKSMQHSTDRMDVSILMWPHAEILMQSRHTGEVTMKEANPAKRYTNDHYNRKAT